MTASCGRYEPDKTQEYYALICRRVSNCDDENANESAGGPQDEDADGNADNVETIVDPPDHLVAAEMAEGPQDLGQAQAIKFNQRCSEICSFWCQSSRAKKSTFDSSS